MCEQTGSFAGIRHMRNYLLAFLLPLIEIIHVLQCHPWASNSSGLLSSVLPPSLSGWNPTQPAEVSVIDDSYSGVRLCCSATSSLRLPLEKVTVVEQAWLLCLSGESDVNLSLNSGIIGHRGALILLWLWSYDIYARDAIMKKHVSQIHCGPGVQ